MVTKTDYEWKQQLSDEQYRITRKHGTERAHTGPHLYEKRKGEFTCVCCGQSLFSSDTKYESGTGWPSYYQPINKDAIGTKVDKSFFSVRTEVHCANCQAHLGHVFNDGPHPTGLRYCINGHALKFVPNNMDDDY